MKIKKDEMHFFQLLHDYLNVYLPIHRNFSTATVRTYRQSLKLLRQYFKEEKGLQFDKLNFSCLSRTNIYDFLLWLKDKRGCSPQTLNLRLSAIKSFLSYCGEEDIELTAVHLDVSSIHNFKGVKKPGVEYLNQSQLKMLFSIPNISIRFGRRDRFFMIFAYETGGRMQELLNLRLSDIISNEATVKIRFFGKGSKIRYVPLLKDVVAHLNAYLSEFHATSPKDAFLFYTIHDSKQTQMKSGTVDYFMKKYGNFARRTDSSFPQGLHAHMLRHSIAMAMYKKGIPISYIKDFLGHACIDTTAIYSYADEDTIAAALESIEHEPFGNQSKPMKNWKGNEQFLLEFCGLE